MAALVVLWTAWQALPFLQRGLNTRWSEEESRRRHLASNVDLTVTSYAFLGLPPTFMHGVMEPWAEFQLIPAYGSAPILSNFDTAVAHGQTVASGDLRWAEDERGNSHTGEATLELHPGTSYVLLFDWAESVEEGTLLISGPTTQRHYSLPNAGERLGFGVSPPHRRGFALSTSHEGVESISLRVHLNAASAAQVSGPRLAQFSLLKVPTEVLPVRLQTLFPLRAEVTAPGEGYYVETPRRFIEGYAALVNGRPVRPVTSPTGQVMIPVPPGLSRVELSFPGSPRLRAVFWSGAASWASLAAFIVIAARWRPHRPMIGQVALVAPAIIFGLVLAIQLRPRDTPAGRALAAPGPLLIELLLPRDKIGAEEVIVASGKPSAGNFISLLYQDPEHVQVRLDVWGSAIASEPVRIDYLQVQELTISAGFLYPADDNETKSLPPWQLHSLRQQVRVELNGKTVIDEPFRTFESAWEDVTFGRSAIGGSLANAQFSGTLAQVRRLVIPTQHWLEDLAAIDVRWPADRWGMQEPLFSVKLAQGLGVLTAQYLHPDSVRLSFHAPDGSVTTSSPVKMALDRTQRLAWATTGADWQISLDGQRVLATQPAPGLESPQLVWLGLNASSVAHVAARFSGVSLRAIERPPPEVPGALQLSLRLPPFQAGAAEPLVITGEAGRADALFITYVDANHVRFGIDHWGVGGHQSPEIAVAYDAVHSIEVMMGSLYPPVGDARWGAVPRAEQEMRKGHVVVRLNGAEVWRLPLATYEVGGAPPAIGVNAIGVSSCAPTFSGQILRAKRSDLR
ncbi:MAG TPA: hypothetical protein VHF69_13580 [Candidatus Synoicihabitans sp.]|nr:hypothetical protein [Candidatus Synoicihabitans sp.]